MTMDPTERFLAACRRQPVDRPPIWIMRQAGRYMPSYQEVRSKVSFMELCRSPELCTEVTLMPIDQLGVDAAILFSDILVPLEGMGLEVSFDDRGPRVAPALRSAAEVAALRVDGADEEVAYVYEAVRQIKAALAGRVPLLGFAGAPLTLAIYAIEGGSSRNRHAVRKMVYEAPEVLEQLLDKLTTVVIRYLRHQVEAGVDAVQIFDTWGGTMSLAEWRRFSLPYTARIMESLKDTGVPLVHYALGSAHLTEGLAELPCDVLSVDWREPLSLIREKTGGRFALQGNVEPGVLTCGDEHIYAAAKACLDDYGDAPGHIFNLGHGITPDVEVAAAKALVDAAKELGARR
ncbi:MAG: uroporphyrinogen decarboxylase [Deltaproteobacteria bacterium]|nr:MAG: uroporphyrinogen decarboxylase [Deltaproteobacteria bacterium]